MAINYKAEQLSITLNELDYWKWAAEKAGNDQVAELLGGPSVQVSGSVDMSQLDSSKTYVVKFLAKMKEGHSALTVKLRLEPEGQDASEHDVTIRETVVFTKYQVGSFTPSSTGFVHFSLFNREKDVAKEGLIIKGVCIEPPIA